MSAVVPFSPSTVLPSAGAPFSSARSGRAWEVRLQLMEMAQELGPGARMPRVVEMCQVLKTSASTVNEVLRELESEGVLRRARGVGIFVAARVQRHVALVCDPAQFQGAHSPFWDLLIQQARARAEAGNENFELHFAPADGNLAKPFQRGLMQEIERGQVNGVIGVQMRHESALWLQRQGVPVVNMLGSAQYGVALDNLSQLIELGREALLERGCRHLAVWQIAGEEGTPALLQEQGRRLAQDAFASERDQPDGIVIANDFMALGALTWLRETGVKVGSDVQIATHANRGSSVLSAFDTDLLLLEIDPAQLVEAAFGTLETLMDGRTPDQTWKHITARLRLGADVPQNRATETAGCLS